MFQTGRYDVDVPSLSMNLFYAAGPPGGGRPVSSLAASAVRLVLSAEA